MTDITPNDIVNKEFRVAFRGYAQDDVDEYLQVVADSLFQALEENQRMRAQISELKARVGQAQQTEELIKSALVAAERTAEDVRANALREVELMRREAEAQLKEEYSDLERLLQFRLRLIAELRGLLTTHLSLLETQERRVPSSIDAGSGEERA